MGRKHPRPMVRYSARLAALICERVASGESLRQVCASDGMPSRKAIDNWTARLPKFAADLAQAKAVAGWAATRGGAGRFTSYCEATAQEIFIRLTAGETLKSICAEPGMPHLGTVHRWRQSRPDFAEAFRLAREIQAESLCDAGLEIAAAVTPQSAYADKVRLGQMRWTAGVLAPARYGRTKPVEAEAAAKTLMVGLRRFEIEENEAGLMRVVGCVPDPVSGEVVRDSESAWKEKPLALEGRTFTPFPPRPVEDRA